MRFDIDGFIIFDTEEASLANLLTGDSIELSATSTRLLTSLLQYRGDIISRLEIFQAVFENYGARVSNSNLNQYISTLRRSLSDLGMEKNVIITVPRIGFKISEEIIVTTDDDTCSPSALPLIDSAPPSPRFIWRNRNALSFSLLLFLGTLSLIYLFFYNNQNDEEIIIQDKCTVYVLDPSPTAETTKNTHQGKILPPIIDCSTPKEIYFFTQTINDAHKLGINVNTFILECGVKNNQCHSYFYREINNA